MNPGAVKEDVELLRLTGLQDLESLAIIGLSKNAGKTTCLNHIIAAWAESCQQRPLALTSVGRDGESEDILNGNPKPRIYVAMGTLIASAEGALLRSDALLEILELSNIRTALGEVVVCRALSDGYVELAGPSVTDELEAVGKLMRKHEPDCLFIIDGALSRRSQAGCGLSEAAILCVSAETSGNPEILAEKASFALNLLQTPSLPESVAAVFSQELLTTTRKCVIMLSGEEPKFSVSVLETPTLVGYGRIVANALTPATTYLFLQGALTDQVVNELLREKNFSNLTVVVEDGTRLFINPSNLHKLHEHGIHLAVVNPLDVRLVCLNPTRSNGHTLPSGSVLAEMRKCISVPVVDLGPRTM